MQYSESLNNKNFDTNYRLGQLYNALGDKNQAMYHLSTALDIDPDNEEA